MKAYYTLLSALLLLLFTACESEKVPTPDEEDPEAKHNLTVTNYLGRYEGTQTCEGYGGVTSGPTTTDVTICISQGNTESTYHISGMADYVLEGEDIAPDSTGSCYWWSWTSDTDINIDFSGDTLNFYINSGGNGGGTRCEGLVIKVSEEACVE